MVCVCVCVCALRRFNLENNSRQAARDSRERAEKRGHLVAHMRASQQSSNKSKQPWVLRVACQCAPCSARFARRSDDDDSVLHASESDADLGLSSSVPGPQRPRVPHERPGILKFMTHAVCRLGKLGRLEPLLTTLAMGPIRFASLCSGFEIFTMVMKALESAIQCLPADYQKFCVKLVHELSCEIDSKKRELCKVISPNLKHLYADVVKLGKGCAFDYIAGRVQKPESPHLVAAGFSCKDLSGMRRGEVQFIHNKKGTSGKTFYGCIGCISMWAPCIVIFENVKQLAMTRSVDQGQRPVDHVDEAMRSLGYIGAHRLVEASEFGIPHRRLRAWLIYFRVGMGDASAAINAISLFTAALIPLVNYIRAHSGAGQVAQADGNGGAKKACSVKDKSRWRAKVAGAMKSLKLTRRECADVQYDLEVANPAFAARTLRVRANLAVQYVKARARADYKKVPIVFQTDQDVPRQPMAVAKVPCICPTGDYWLAYGPLREHRYLTARELASLQGVGEEELAMFRLKDVPDRLLKDLSGNAFSGPVCVAVVLSALMAWKRKADL